MDIAFIECSKNVNIPDHSILLAASFGLKGSRDKVVAQVCVGTG